MEPKKRKVSPLVEVEMEVLAQGQEWMRQQYEKKLQKLADAEGKISPPEPPTHHALPSLPDSADDLRGRSAD